LSVVLGPAEAARANLCKTAVHLRAAPGTAARADGAAHCPAAAALNPYDFHARFYHGLWLAAVVRRRAAVAILTCGRTMAILHTHRAHILLQSSPVGVRALARRRTRLA
jgi:hypothetical protein